MPKLEALCNCPYGVGVQPKGSHFDATENDAKILVAIGRARRVSDPIAPPSKTDRLIDAIDKVFGEPAVVNVPEVTHAHERAGTVPGVGDINHAEPEPARVKRPYRRRDMTAEN